MKADTTQTSGSRKSFGRAWQVKAKATAARLWRFHKAAVLLAAGAAALAIYFVGAWLSRPADPALAVQFINFYGDVSQTSAFSRGFSDFCGDTLTGPVVFDQNAFFDLTHAGDYTNNYYVKTVTYLEAGSRDGIVCGEKNIEGLAKSGRLMDLRDARTAALYAAYPDRLWSVNYEGESIPVAIRLDGSFLPGMAQSKETSWYFAVSANVRHPAMAAQFVSYLFAGRPAGL